MSELKVPDYRIRLFLSVDLTGSTAFKSKHDTQLWRAAFREFYGRFPKSYEDSFQKKCTHIGGMSPQEKSATPKVWKTIGDEILFVNRVYSVTHLGAYVAAFSETLHTFGEFIGRTYAGLNAKGNGWIAAFPSPNKSIAVSHTAGEDPFAGVHGLETEEFELEVDENPKNFDFLGKGIDGGFRISRNSTVDTFTISPALAYLLTEAASNKGLTKFELGFNFEEMQSFKGVLDGSPCPIISIDTMRSKEERELREMEASLLGRPSMVGNLDDFKGYLEKFIQLRRVEMPSLKLSHGQDDLPPPEHYEDFVAQWNTEKETVAQQDKNQTDASLEDGDVSKDESLPDVDDLSRAISGNPEN
ncbi:hypothetical protein J7394_18925 [Ruegeria sp. R13_0]|uniref:hypothetical protein n=1 Tax=Ruegeria sp. R13_0 TaxID=2821099 RepID=UPI001ADBAB5C|nr:hypothetical protein [Ruegeria sp. R13_0]MBO9436301.1 hypothetical protein [Ruegeria sp. R13_0]